MFFSPFFSVFLLFYFVFFFLDMCSGIHFFDFIELGILLVISLVYFFVSFFNVTSSAIWSFCSSSFYFYGSVRIFNLGFFGSSGFVFFLLSLYHSSLLFLFSSFRVFCCFSFSSFFFSDGIDFLYNSYSLSTLWLFCVLVFCSLFVVSTFSSVSSLSSSFFLFSLKSHFLLELNAFFTVVFYVLGLFCFCLFGLVLWFSLFYDNYGVVREFFGCQWFWGETVCDIFSEWRSSSIVAVSDLSSSQSRLLTTVRPFFFDVNVLYCINLSSLDVIHSFGLPKFGVKVDVMPGVVSHVSFFSVVPCLVSLICSELCGAKHSQMYAEVIFG